ncbi:hypothetical protein C8F04DRAFT_1190146 [Mycena alexandri]|uniref:CxC2-like cysteine cluster KDZ transposase-associated domain-containing protein n=1 Tax=Mycena alexandri TaxID=1745969 RepID=A0AAD6SGT2_9AGAR|nr:hypothetical protein C8F04DRAFT_1190146 [Mycena alexandri]
MAQAPLFFDPGEVTLAILLFDGLGPLLFEDWEEVSQNEGMLALKEIRYFYDHLPDTLTRLERLSLKPLPLLTDLEHAELVAIRGGSVNPLASIIEHILVADPFTASTAWSLIKDPVRCPMPTYLYKDKEKKSIWCLTRAPFSTTTKNPEHSPPDAVLFTRASDEERHRSTVEYIQQYENKESVGPLAFCGHAVKIKVNRYSSFVAPCLYHPDLTERQQELVLRARDAHRNPNVGMRKVRKDLREELGREPTRSEISIRTREKKKASKAKGKKRALAIEPPSFKIQSKRLQERYGGKAGALLLKSQASRLLGVKGAEIGDINIDSDVDIGAEENSVGDMDIDENESVVDMESMVDSEEDVRFRDEFGFRAGLAGPSRPTAPPSIKDTLGPTVCAFMSGLPPPGFFWVIKAPQYPKPKGSNHKRHRKPCLVAVGSGSEETPIYVGPGTRDEPWEFDLEDDEAPNGAISPGPSTSPTNQALTFPSTSTSKKMLTPKDLYMNGLLPPICPPQSNPILFEPPVRVSRTLEDLIAGDNNTCAQCQSAYNADSPTTVHVIKCRDCGKFLQCKACCLSHHTTAPLHVIKEWTGLFWFTISLAALGLVYQLGHGGFPCRFPGDRVYKMTVIEAPTIHQIQMRYCACSRSDAADKVDQLLRHAWYPVSLTDPVTCSTFKTLSAFRLYNVVGNMNLHDFVRAMERSTDATASTGMTWLPDRYKPFQRMARQWAFLSRLQRAGCAHKLGGIDATQTGEAGVNCWPCLQDKKNLPANWRDVEPRFRLKNRMRSNEIDDPPLGPSWSYWVEPKRYHQHLKKYVGKKDMSTCIAFAALLQKDTRITTSLRSSGVGGCVCARHECREWKKNFPARHDKMPKALKLPLDQIELQCALPVRHAGSHNKDCQRDNSLSYKTGVSKSDSEGVERVWSVLNPTANHTKDAGRGQRVDALEDKIDSHNFAKNVGQGRLGDALQRKLLVAIAERDKQVEAFKEISSTIERSMRSEWKKKVVAWHEDPTQENQYTLRRKDCPTAAEVRLEVKRDEDAVMLGATSPLQGSTATAFLIAGLRIEEAQRRIIACTPRQDRQIPGPAENLHAQRCRHARGGGGRTRPRRTPPKAERIKLLMPSQMKADSNDPLRGCVKGLLAMEAKLRVAQCNNSLVKLWARLHAKRHFIAFRNEHVTGQIQSTKARTLIGQIGERVEACAQKYRNARTALIQLSGEADAFQFRELRAQVLQLDGDAGETDAAARKKLAMISAGRAPGALDDEEERLHDSVQIEWVRYLEWQADWWWEHTAVWVDTEFVEIAAGLRGYALKQADLHRRLGVFFEHKWNMPAVDAARGLVALEAAGLDEDTDLEEFFHI